MVEILDANNVQRQVPELFHHSPELRVVSHQRNDARITAFRRHIDLDVINKTGQQPSAFAPDDDPVPPGEASRSDHEGSRCRVPMLEVGG